MSKKEKSPTKTKDKLLGLAVNIQKLEGGGEMVVYKKVLSLKDSEKVVEGLREWKKEKETNDFKIVPSVTAGQIKGYIIYGV